MANIRIRSNRFFYIILGTVVWFATFLAPAALAQDDDLALEEIIVTAQRREQSFQDVPIAIEIFSGNTIRRQGFRNLDDLANFSPTVLIEPRVQDQDVSIRGFGTTGNALTLDQAAPFFIDGIHFGRQSQIKLAFLDIDSLEVLKGPQPVYFGQNATAGAFNIRSNRPTESWEGYVNAEFGSNEAQKLEFGAGGPINDKWGVRVSGVRDTSDGYMTYVVTGAPYGAYENTGGRTILQFTPNDRLQITGKVEASRIRKDSETISSCRTGGPLIFGRGGPLDDTDEYDPPDPVGDERSVWGEPELDPANPGINTGGAEWSQPFTPLPTACFSNELSVSEGGPYFEAPQTIREENSNVGSVDIREAAQGAAIEGGNNGILGYEDIDGANAYIDVVYDFDNDASIQWLSGWASYERDYVQDNSNSPFLMNFQGRGEDFQQFSSEIRFRSAPDKTIEWEVGAFFQTTDLTAFSNSLRSNVRQSQRSNIITEEVDFSAIFGNITFNIGDRFSIDVGGRYQDHDKFATAEGFAASWVFDVCPDNPCDPGLTPVDVLFDPVLDGYAGCEGVNDEGDVYCLVDPATARLFVDVAPGTLLYAMPFRETRDVPPQWWSGNARPVGLTAMDFPVRGPDGRGEGPWAVPFVESGFNPQVTLRFRAGENLTFYARYAESTKIGGFDTGQTSIPRDIDELTFETEDAEQIELGIKGTLMDGRFAFDADIFQLEFPNLQTTALSPDPEQTSASVNAGQRVQGLEFNMRFAATEGLLFGFSGAFMDGEMTEFVGAGCTDAEIFAALSDSSAPCRIFDEDGNLQVPPIDAEEALDDFTAIINRTGTPAPRTPEWKFVLTADYYVPIGANFEFTFNAKGYMSDGYILDVESFDDVVKYDEHEDLNIIIGLRNPDKGWAVSAFARNLLEARPTYFPSKDVFPNGLESAHLSPASFTTYGVKFEYFFD